MIAYAVSIMSQMGLNTNGKAVDLFNQAGVDFVLEAWGGAKFGELRNAEHVRLVLDDQPDFLLRFDSCIEEKWEFTEADVHGRRRGDEYRDMAEDIANRREAVADDPVENWVQRADQVPDVLRDRATNKAKKAYPKETHLLIYLNVNEFGIRHKEIEEGMADATEPASGAFEEVWILWKEQAYRLWKDGKPAFKRISRP